MYPSWRITIVFVESNAEIELDSRTLPSSVFIRDDLLLQRCSLCSRGGVTREGVIS